MLCRYYLQPHVETTSQSRFLTSIIYKDSEDLKKQTYYADFYFVASFWGANSNWRKLILGEKCWINIISSWQTSFIHGHASFLPNKHQFFLRSFLLSYSKRNSSRNRVNMKAVRITSAWAWLRDRFCRRQVRRWRWRGARSRRRRQWWERTRESPPSCRSGKPCIRTCPFRSEPSWALPALYDSSFIFLRNHC